MNLASIEFPDRSGTFRGEERLVRAVREEHPVIRGHVEREVRPEATGQSRAVVKITFPRIVKPPTFDSP